MSSPFRVVAWRGSECGRVESNHHSRRRRGYSPLSSPVLSVRVERAADRTRTGTARITTSNACRYTTAATSGDDRSRTGGLSPDKRVLWPLSYAPNIARVGFEPTSRAHEAREESRSSTARREVREKGLAGWSRTS